MSRKKKGKKRRAEEPEVEATEDELDGEDELGAGAGDAPASSEEPASTGELTPMPGAARRHLARGGRSDRPGAWQRHDLLVILAALALLAAGVFAYRSLTAPQLERLSRFGLSLDRPAVWLPPRPVPLSKPRLAFAVTGAADSRESTPEAGAEDLPVHVMFQSPIDPLTRLEIRIAKRPTFRNLRGALSLARVNRYGEVYWAAESGRETFDGRDWVRTRFRYAYKASAGDSPKVSSAIEYATLNGNLVYVVTFHGNESEAERLRALLAPTLSVDPNHPAATGRSDETR